MELLQIVFIIITLVAVGLFYVATGFDKRLLGFYAVWLAITAILPISGFLQNTDAVPPRVLLVLLPAFLSVVILVRAMRSRVINQRYLLAIHGLRLPVELVLHQLYLQGKVPVIMTYEGWNFDILVGISALILLLYSFIKGKGINPMLFKVWNIIGIVFLSIIVVVAIFSAPLAFQQLAFEQPNVAVLQFPYTYLPAVVVPIVLSAHLLGLKLGIGTKSVNRSERLV